MAAIAGWLKRQAAPPRELRRRGGFAYLRGRALRTFVSAHAGVKGRVAGDRRERTLDAAEHSASIDSRKSGVPERFNRGAQNAERNAEAAAALGSVREWMKGGRMRFQGSGFGAPCICHAFV